MLKPQISHWRSFTFNCFIKDYFDISVKRYLVREMYSSVFGLAIFLINSHSTESSCWAVFKVLVQDVCVPLIMCHPWRPPWAGLVTGQNDLGRIHRLLKEVYVKEIVVCQRLIIAQLIWALYIHNQSVSWTYQLNDIWTMIQSKHWLSEAHMHSSLGWHDAKEMHNFIYNGDNYADHWKGPRFIIIWTCSWYKVISVLKIRVLFNHWGGKKRFSAHSLSPFLSDHMPEGKLGKKWIRSNKVDIIKKRTNPNPILSEPSDVLLVGFLWCKNNNHQKLYLKSDRWWLLYGSVCIGVTAVSMISSLGILLQVSPTRVSQLLKDCISMWGFESFFFNLIFFQRY